MERCMTTERECGRRMGEDPEQACGDANAIVGVVSARRFDFDGLQPSTSMDVVVAENVSWASEARLNVRAHPGTEIGGAATIEVIVFAVAPSLSSSGLNFQTAPPQDSLATVELPRESHDPQVGRLRGGAVDEELGSHVTIVVRGTQAGSVTDCRAVLSAELVLKRRPRERGGRRVTVLSRTDLDYSHLAPSTSETTVLVPAFDVRDYRTGFVAVRALDRSIDAGAEIDVTILNAFPDSNDPNLDFLDEDDVAASFAISDGSGPQLHTARLEPGFGPFLLVKIEAKQSSSGGTLEASLDMDFVGQE
jgi:hypothetical protein